jgi:hypothetical protein
MMSAIFCRLVSVCLSATSTRFCEIEVGPRLPGEQLAPPSSSAFAARGELGRRRALEHSLGVQLSKPKILSQHAIFLKIPEFTARFSALSKRSAQIPRRSQIPR